MEKISHYQVAMMGSGIILDATLISVPGQIIGVAKQGAWVAYPLSVCLTFLSMWMIIRAMQRFPGKDLSESLVERHSVLGRVIVLLYLLFIFLVLVRDLRSMALFIIIALLPQTPLAVVSALVVLTVIFIVRGGVEIVARMTELFQPILILALTVLPIFMIKEFDWFHIQPIYEPGLYKNMLSGTWLALPYIGEIMILPLFLPAKTFSMKSSTYGLLIGALMLQFLLLQNLLVTGVQLSSRFMYPNHELVRQIRMTDFLDRFDLLLVSIWLPTIIIKISFSLYAICHGLKRILPKVSAKELSVPIGCFALVCSFWFFENSNQMLNFNKPWPYIGLVFQMLLPFLFFCFLRPKKKRA